MKKALYIFLALTLFILGGCRGRHVVSCPPIPYVDSILTSPHMREHALLVSCTGERVNADIAVIDSPERCVLLSETFMSSDVFDNVDGSAAADGLPDFAGERIASIMDDRYIPYSGYIGGREADLREIAVRAFMASLDTVCRLAAYDADGRSHKPSAKAVVLSSPLMAVYGRSDIDTLIRSFGVDIPVFSPVTSMISAAVSEGRHPVNIAVLASPEVSRSRVYQRVFSEMMKGRGDTVSVCKVICEPVAGGDSAGVSHHADILRSVLDTCRAAGMRVDALLIDDYAVSVPELERICHELVSSDDEADIARKQSLAADFRIIDPRMSIVSDCFKSFREKNIFTHNIAYPVASAYITSPESAHFSIMDFDESSLPDGVYEILTDMAPKTHKSYVQNQHFAGGN